MTTNAFAQYAAHMLKGGYSPVPIVPGTKRPTLKGWNNLRDKPLSAESINKLAWSNPRLGLAVVGGFNGLVPVDIDTKDREILKAAYRALPKVLVAKRGSKGFTAFFWDGGSGQISAEKMMHQFNEKETRPLVEILTTGSSTIPPTIHEDTHEPYEWLTRHSLFTCKVDDLPIITTEDIERLRDTLSKWLVQRKKFVPTPVVPGFVVSNRRYEAYATKMLAGETMRLSCMSAETGRNNALFKAACKVGKFVHHRILQYSDVESALIGACKSNGLWRDKNCGPHGCVETIKSGLSKAVNDALPALPDRKSRHIWRANLIRGEENVRMHR